MSASKKIKQILIERNMALKDLADKLNITPQNLSNKFFRDTFSYKEYEKIMDILGCDVKTIMRDTQKEF
jgi:DNA-binding Xre family transcriptional regulator